MLSQQDTHNTAYFTKLASALSAIPSGKFASNPSAFEAFMRKFISEDLNLQPIQLDAKVIRY